VDINRAFEADEVAEVRILKQVLDGQQMDYFVDFHEDWEAQGFYLYEGCRGGEGVGDEVIAAVETIGAIDPDADGDAEAETRLSRGVFAVARSWGTQGLAPYMLEFHAAHSLIFETPTSWSIDARVAAHHLALRAALAGLRGRATA